MRMRRMRASFIGSALWSALAFFGNGCGYLEENCQNLNESCGNNDASVVTDAHLSDVIDSGPNFQCCDATVGTADAGSSSADAGLACGDASFCGAGEGCVDTATSIANCGGCGHVCSA